MTADRVNLGSGDEPWRRYRVLFVLLALAYVALAMHLPVSVYTTAGHDDAWFIGNAEGIAAGDWFGPFSQMTLIKGPMYSLFLAANHFLGLPVTLAIGLFYLLGCWMLVDTLTRVGMPRAWSVFLFFLLLFQPALFPVRVIRDNIYPALTLLVLAGFIALMFRERTGLTWTRTLLYGLALGAFWGTREEGLWLMPALILLLAYATVRRWVSRTAWLPFVAGLTVYAAAAASPLLAVAAINHWKYGTFEVVDFKGEAFAGALARLNSIDAGPEVAHVPVPRVKRERAYAISPAFAELRPYFEDAGKHWTDPGCAIYPDICGDYAGGWFMWALRDAAAAKGYYASPGAAATFYRRISAEIDSACRQSRIACRTQTIPFLPAISASSVAEIPAKLVEAIGMTLYQSSVPSTGGPSWPPPERLADIRFFLGNPVTVAAASEPVAIHTADWIDAKTALARLYRWMTPAIFAAGLVAFGVALYRAAARRTAPGEWFWLALCFWVAYASRVGLLVLVDVSSFPAIDYLYMATALPLLHVAAVLSLLAALRSRRASGAAGNLRLAGSPHPQPPPGERPSAIADRVGA